jgi:hypothetical protein
MRNEQGCGVKEAKEGVVMIDPIQPGSKTPIFGGWPVRKGFGGRPDDPGPKKPLWLWLLAVVVVTGALLGYLYMVTRA